MVLIPLCSQYLILELMSSKQGRYEALGAIECGGGGRGSEKREHTLRGWSGVGREGEGVSLGISGRMKEEREEGTCGKKVAEMWQKET